MRPSDGVSPSNPPKGAGKAQVGREGQATGKYHHHDMLDAVSQGFVAAAFPVPRRGAFLSQHHGRAMGEEMDGGERLGRFPWGVVGHLCVCCLLREHQFVGKGSGRCLASRTRRRARRCRRRCGPSLSRWKKGLQLCWVGLCLQQRSPHSCRQGCFHQWTMATQQRWWSASKGRSVRVHAT